LQTLAESLHFETHDLFEFLCEFKNAYFMTAQSQKINLEILADSTGQVYMDRDKIFQFFSNILSNAIQHSEANTTITIHGHVDNENAFFFVNDEVCGINPENLKNVFERGWQTRVEIQVGTVWGYTLFRRLFIHTVVK